MAVAVLWVGIATKLVKALRHFSFLSRRKGSHTCGPLCHSNCDIIHAIAWVLKTVEILRKKDDFWNRHFHPSCCSFFSQQKLGSCCDGSWQLRLWGRGHSERPTRHLQVTIATAALQGPTSSHMVGSILVRNIDRNRSLTGLTPCGRSCFNFALRMLGLRPSIPNGRRNKSKYYCHLLLPNCPSKTFLRSSND
jgi:hypothetical protein